MQSSNPTSGEHRITEVKEMQFNYPAGTRYFTVYWTHGRTGLKYVFPNIAARDELDAYVIAMKKLDIGVDTICLPTP
jgi:hypothetical protein